MTKIYPTSQSQCSKCGGQCCKRIPGNCVPEDIRRLFPAETLRESVIKALKTGKFSIDWWEADKPLYYIRPSTVTGAGKVYDGSWGGQCVFLTASGCELGPARPFNCKMLKPRRTEAGDCTVKSKLNMKILFGRLWRRHIDLSQFRDIEPDEPYQPDLHRKRASEMFGVPYEDVTAEQRQAGKRDNYVRLYSVRGPLEKIA